MPLNPSDAQKIEKIIRQNAPETLVSFAAETGSQLVQDQMTSNQIRNIFGEARKIQARWRQDVDGSEARTSLILLKPKLVYQAARHSQVGRLKDVLTKAIDAVTDDQSSAQIERERFGNFMNLFEAVVAYHKAAGGKD